MLALAFAAALRREELCGLQSADLNLQWGTLRVAVPGRPERTVALSPLIIAQCALYMRERSAISMEGALFVSESRRNYASPLSIWSWSKAVQSIARQSGVEQFTTHTPRHLRLTDMARAGHTPRELAQFAGLRSINLARQYYHLASESPESRNSDIERRRESQLADALFRETA